MNKLKMIFLILSCVIYPTSYAQTPSATSTTSLCLLGNTYSPGESCSNLAGIAGLTLTNDQAILPSHLYPPPLSGAIQMSGAIQINYISSPVVAIWASTGSNIGACTLGDTVNVYQLTLKDGVGEGTIKTSDLVSLNSNSNPAIKSVSLDTTLSCSNVCANKMDKTCWLPKSSAKAPKNNS